MCNVGCSILDVQCWMFNVGCSRSASHALPRRRFFMQPRLASFAALVHLGAGCAEYHVGVGSLYRNDIRTVGVQMFDSFSYRRNLGERLTEAVVKEIEHRTPYKVVDADRADMLLTGVIIIDNKDVVIRSHLGDPRVGKITMGVHVTWAGRQTTLPMPAAVTDVSDAGQVVPE